MPLIVGCGGRFKKRRLKRVRPLSTTSNEATIAQELIDAQGAPTNIDGYYLPDEAKVSTAMKPSQTLANAIDL